MEIDNSAYDLKALLTQVAVMLKLSDQEKLDQRIEKLKDCGALKVLAYKENKEKANQCYAAPNRKHIPQEMWSKNDREMMQKAALDNNFERKLTALAKKPDYNKNKWTSVINHPCYSWTFVESFWWGLMTITTVGE